MQSSTSRRAPSRRFFAFLLTSTLGLSGVTAATAAAAEGEWPHMRGPEDGGMSLMGGAGIELSADWSVPLGSGYSGIVVSGDRLVTAFADGSGTDVVAAFDPATGKEIWRSRLDTTFEGRAGSQDGPVAAPTIDGDTVYMTGPHGVLVAFALADGAERWRVELVKDLGAVVPEYGCAATPLIAGGQVVVEIGIPGKGTVHGFDTADGALQWSAMDDPVGYQAPIVAEIAGVRQIVAVTDEMAAGVEIGTGRVLWQARHAEENAEGISQPAVADDGVIVFYWSEPSVYLKVRKDGDTWSAEKAWQADAFGRSYAIPASIGGHFYGFRGSILHAVDAASGEVVWRSRPPGARALTRVGDNLLFLDRSGQVVVAEASPEGWKELARTEVFDADSYTPPSYADGRIYVRNLEKLAAVSVLGKLPPESGSEQAEERSQATDWSQFVDMTDAKGLTAGEAMAEALRSNDAPWVSGGKVFFSWVGAAEDVTLLADFAPGGEAQLERVDATDVWAYITDLPEGGVWEYRFAVDLGEPQADPRNPRSIVMDDRERSWFATGEWSPSPWLTPFEAEGADGRAQGRDVTVEVQSEARGDTRTVRVHLPAGYGRGDRTYPLLVVTDGEKAEKAGLTTAADRLLAAGKIEPVLIAYVPFTGWQEQGFTATPDFGRFLGEELVPRLRAELAVGPAREDVVLWGPLDGAAGAFSAALQSPGTFRQLVLQDMQTWSESEDHLAALLRSADVESLPPISTFWTETGVSSPTLGRSSHRDRAWLGQVLPASGITWSAESIPGGSTWANWRQYFPGVLVGLYGP